MSRRAARFTVADINRALKAVEASGMPMAVEVLVDGTIRIVPTIPVPIPTPDRELPSAKPRRRIIL
jgi:hypothetical protein